LRHALRVIAVVLVAALPGLASSAAAETQTSVCAECHPDVVEGIQNQTHMMIESFEVGGRAVGCEGCHGDGTQHMDEGDPALIRTFGEDGAGDAAE